MTIPKRPPIVWGKLILVRNGHVHQLRTRITKRYADEAIAGWQQGYGTKYGYLAFRPEDESTP
jgi:hypothetical protein